MTVLRGTLKKNKNRAYLVYYEGNAGIIRALRLVDAPEILRTLVSGLTCTVTGVRSGSRLHVKRLMPHRYPRFRTD